MHRSTSSGLRVFGCSLVCAVAAVLILSAGAAFAQEPPNRSGFSLLLTMGVGFQSTEFLDESAVGLGGLNLGIGGFLTPDLALFFRISGTNVNQTDFDITTVSAVGGPSVQWWVNDSINLEGGLGFGVVDYEGFDDNGFGLILGAGFSVFHRGKNSLQFGVEYAPVFVDSGNVQNVSIAFGWQLL